MNLSLKNGDLNRSRVVGRTLTGDGVYIHIEWSRILKTNVAQKQRQPADFHFAMVKPQL